MLRFISLILLASLATPVRAGQRFDVSYLWSRNRSAVAAYKLRVGRVLGPAVAKRLQVVRRGRLYGLIYDRDATGGAVKRIVQAHGRILSGKGLDRPSPVKNRRWRVLGRAAGARRPSTRLKRTAHAVRAAPVPIRTEGIDSPLEAKVERYIKRLRRRGRIRGDERTAWSVFDLATGEKLVSINEDRPLQAASLIKPFFALAFFAKVASGDLSYGPKSRRMMRAMIQHSSNRATNWVLRRVGGPAAVDRLLRRRYGSLFRQTRIVEYIPPGGRTYRNKASAHDYSRFLYALWKGGLPGSKEIKRLMALPNRDRVFTGAKEVPPGVRVVDKTGSTSRLCANMGVLDVPGADGRSYAYTIIGIIEKQRPARSYTRWIRRRGNVIREVSNIVYREMAGRHPLDPASYAAAR